MSEMVERAMIHRRGFITGLISLVAAPVATAQVISNEGVIMALNQHFVGKSIIIGDGDLYMNCEFDDCCISIAPDTNSAKMLGCQMRKCTFTDQYEVLKPFMEECYAWESHIGFECRVPIS